MDHTRCTLTAGGPAGRRRAGCHVPALTSSIKALGSAPASSAPWGVRSAWVLKRGLLAGGELDAMSQLPTGEVAVQADLQILFLRFLAEPAVVLLPLDVKCAQQAQTCLCQLRKTVLSSCVSVTLQMPV